MPILAPDFFHETIKSSKMKLDDVTFLEFRTFDRDMRYEICLQCNLIVFILQGTKQIRHLDKEHRIHQGDGLFLRKNHYLMSHVMGSRNKTYRSFILMVDDRYFEKFVRRHAELFEARPSARPHNFNKFKMTPLIRATVDSVVPYFKYQHKHTKRILQLKLDELLINLIQADRGKAILATIKDAASRQKNDFARFIEMNYTQPWSLETFAAQSGRSLSVFKKEFKQVYQVPPKQWINRKRLERARYLLKHSEYAVTEISHLAGYSNLSHFIQSFKKAFHTTPKQLQKA